MTARRGDMDKFIDQPMLLEIGTTIYTGSRFDHIPDAPWWAKKAWFKIVAYNEGVGIVVMKQRRSTPISFARIYVRVSRRDAVTFMKIAQPLRKSAATPPQELVRMTTMSYSDYDGSYTADYIRRHLDGVRASRAERSQREAGNDRGIL